MIIHSPETPMPQPYKGYIHQRAERIGAVLRDVVGNDTNMQLCPRPILPSEQEFNDDPNSLLVGCVVESKGVGDKNQLYDRECANGIATTDKEQLITYATQQFTQKNKVRFKDPRASDGNAQLTVASLKEVNEYLNEIDFLDEYGVVAMPHLAEITDRIMVSKLVLGQFGTYEFFSRELQTNNNFCHHEVFAGADMLGVCSDRSNKELLYKRAQEELTLSSEALREGEEALRYLENDVVRFGRGSVDVVSGFTDNKSSITTAIDCSLRVGGITPGEVLIVRELQQTARAVCRAEVRLDYAPGMSHTEDWENFVCSASLNIAARIV